MSIEESLSTTAKLTLVNLRTGERAIVEFNPDELEESFSVNWTRQSPQGVPHQPLQYSNTGNLVVPLTLYCQGVGLIKGAERIGDFKKFIMALGYPSSGANSITTGAPPRVLVVWPKTLAFQAVLTGEVKFKHSHFGTDGRSLRYQATVTFEEIRDFRLTSEDVRRMGTMRAPGGGASGTTT